MSKLNWNHKHFFFSMYDEIQIIIHPADLYLPLHTFHAMVYSSLIEKWAYGRCSHLAAV